MLPEMKWEVSFPLQIKITEHFFSYFCYLNTKDDDFVVKEAGDIMYGNASNTRQLEF